MPDIAAGFVLLLAAALAAIAAFAGLRMEHVRGLIISAGLVNAAFLMAPVGASLGKESWEWTMQGAAGFQGFAMVLMLVGALLVTVVAKKASGHGKLNGFSGLYYRAPWTAAAMTALLFSLAGVPVSAGFMGKLYILLELSASGVYWIAAILAMASIVSAYSLFNLVVQMYMRSYDGKDGGELRMHALSRCIVYACAAGSLLLGVFPGLLA